MSTDISEKAMRDYEEDSRVACQYGAKCYQKNPVHHKKFKHPPAITKTTSSEETVVKKGIKRKMKDCDDGDEKEFGELDESQSKHRKDDVSTEDADAHCLSPSASESIEDDDSDNLICKNSGDKDCNDESDDESVVYSSGDDERGNTAKKVADTAASSLGDKAKILLNRPLNPSNNLSDAKEVISKLFLLDMPKDFYKFYEFCTTISDKDPSSALKLVDLRLVGPFDVLNGTIREIPESDDDKEKFLRHWRYFYDPPEFQTILKGNDKEGLHYGYWRDECDKNPTLVAKNSANVSCKVLSVASNIFGAVKFHIDERLKVANVFDKSKIARILKLLTTFAKDHEITIERHSAEMRDRDRKVVTKTFHGAGIVVPYDKKTQVGYRILAATDSQLHKILDKIAKAEDEDIKKKYMSDIEEIVRMAAIAADECDFGTPLELAHDLFSSGVEFTQRTMLHMFTMSYSLLRRPQFSKIAVAHMKDRKKGCDLSVI